MGTPEKEKWKEQQIEESSNRVKKCNTLRENILLFFRITKTPFMLLFVSMGMFLLAFCIAIYWLEQQPVPRERTWEEEKRKEREQRMAWIETDTLILYRDTAGRITGNVPDWNLETIRGFKFSFIRYAISKEYPDSMTFFRFKMLYDFYDPRVFEMEDRTFFSFTGKTDHSHHIAEKGNDHWQIINVWDEEEYRYSVQNDSVYQLVLVKE